MKKPAKKKPVSKDEPSLQGLIVETASEIYALDGQLLKVLKGRNVASLLSESEDTTHVSARGNIENYIETSNERMDRLKQMIDGFDVRKVGKFAGGKYGALLDVLRQSRLNRTQPDFSLAEFLRALNVIVHIKISLYMFLRIYCELLGDDDAADRAQESYDEERDFDDFMNEDASGLSLGLLEEENPLE